MVTWRENVNKEIKDHLEFHVRESAKYQEAYRTAKNPSNAQLWIAIANLSKQVFELNLKLNLVERALKDFVKPNEIKKVEKSSKIKSTKKDTKALGKSLKKL